MMGSKQTKGNKENPMDFNFPNNFVNPYNNNYYYPNTQYLNTASYGQMQPNTVQMPYQFYNNYSLRTPNQYQNFKLSNEQIIHSKFPIQPFSQQQVKPIHQDLYPPKANSMDGSYGLSCSSSTIPSVSSQNSGKLPPGSFNYTSVHQ